MQLTFLSEEPLARASASPDFAEELLTIEATSHLSLFGWLKDLSPAGWFGRMCLVSCHQGGGRDFGSFLGGLAECGYGFAYRILDAQYFGVPQRRRRVFVVGYLGDWRPAAAVLFERDGLRGDITPCREAGQKAAGTISACTSGGGGLGTDFELDGGLQTFDRQSSAEYGTANIASTVSARDYKSPSDLMTYGIHGNWIGRKPENGGNATEPMHDVSPNLISTDRHAVAFEPGIMSREGGHFYEDVSGTIRKDPGDNQMSVLSKMKVRRLTPRECERLQGFPDDYTLIPVGKKMSSDSVRYKALGNSMAVPVMKWIGERIDMVDKLL